MKTTYLLRIQFSTISMTLVMILAPIPLVPMSDVKIHRSMLHDPMDVAFMIGNRIHAMTPVNSLEPTNDPISQTTVLAPRPRLLKTNHLFTTKANSTPTIQDRILLMVSSMPNQRTKAA